MPPPTDHLQLLPLELKIDICEFLCDHCTASWYSTPDVNDDVDRPSKITSEPLRNLCLTSKAMREAAQPVLFHFFIAHTPGLEARKDIPDLLSALNENPHLSEYMKSLSISLNVLDPIWYDDSATVMEEPGSDQVWHDSRPSTLLERVSGLKELEIAFEEGWVPGNITLPQLKELSIHYETFPNGTLDATMTSTFLNNQPLLCKLTLINFVRFDQTIYGSFQNIREFCVINRQPHANTSFITISTLFRAMPQLESFIFRETIFPSDLTDSRDLLQGLLVCKQTLKSLRLDRCIHNAGDLLQEFSKLESLSLYKCNEHAGERFPKFPHSLKKLVFQRWTNSPDGSLRHLSTNTGSYPNLKDIYELLYCDLDMIRSLTLQQIFVVHFDLFRPLDVAGIRFRIHFKEYDEPKFMARSWGRNMEPYWTETLRLNH